MTISNTAHAYQQGYVRGLREKSHELDKAVAEAEKKLLRTLLTECDRTENEGGRLLVTTYILAVKKEV